MVALKCNFIMISMFVFIVYEYVGAGNLYFVIYNKRRKNKFVILLFRLNSRVPYAE